MVVELVPNLSKPPPSSPATVLVCVMPVASCLPPSAAPLRRRLVLVLVAAPPLPVAPAISAARTASARSSTAARSTTDTLPSLPRGSPLRLPRRRPRVGGGSVSASTGNDGGCGNDDCPPSGFRVLLVPLPSASRLLPPPPLPPLPSGSRLLRGCLTVPASVALAPELAPAPLACVITPRARDARPGRGSLLPSCHVRHHVASHHYMLHRTWPSCPRGGGAAMHGA